MIEDVMVIPSRERNCSDVSCLRHLPSSRRRPPEWWPNHTVAAELFSDVTVLFKELYIEGRLYIRREYWYVAAFKDFRSPENCLNYM